MPVFDGDGRPALQTSFYFPLGVCFDRSDQPLIVDWNNLRIRRINEDGTVQTIMGKDYEDFPTDAALAIDTPLHHASDIAFDTAGNLYVAGNHVPVVFRVGTDNRVHTVAGTMDVGYDGDGGPALQAKLNTPFAVLPTSDGGFYVSDAEAHVLRYVDSAGIIRTVAGTGTAGYSGDGGAAAAALLNGPTHMRLDPRGNLYFCDTENHVIRRLDTRGTITTVAGTGAMGYGGDNGPAERAQFNTPFDLRFAPDGTLYVADTGNNVIRRINAAGVVATVVGTGSRGFAGDGADARLAQLNRPSGITFATDGALWIADTYNHRVRRVHAFVAPR
jgi:sugar lactone lactonase YvrE